MNNILRSVRPLLDKAGLWALIGVVIGCLLTYFFSIQLTKYDIKQERIEVANIVYYDLEKSIKTLQVQKETGEGVIKNKFTNLSDEYQSLIIKLRKDLSNEDINNLLTYYGNVSFLEIVRLNYWNGNTSQNSLIEYLDTFNLINYSSQELLDVSDLLEKVKKIADIN